MRLLEVEQFRDPHGQPRELRDPADRQKHAGHEAHPVQGVVPDRQCLALQTEDHLLVSHETG